MIAKIYLILVLFLGVHLHADDNASCLNVRIADTGWSDVSATTAVAEIILSALGYKTNIFVLSLPVAYMGLRNKDLDFFLGNWMPTQKQDIQVFLDEGSLKQIHQNLLGARFSLAVPDYVYEQGVHSFADLERHYKDFSGKIYGIEPGNDGNRLISAMIEKNAFGLKNWELVESSEQGMLVSVEQAVQNHEWIAFLAWAPHPMNITMNIHYLSGGDEYFGANFGAASVHTVTRSDYQQECPNLYNFLTRLTFTVEAENYLMNLMSNKGLSAQEAALVWLKDYEAIALDWLKGVKDSKGNSGAKAFLDVIQVEETKKAYALPIGEWIKNGLEILNKHFSVQFRYVSSTIESIISSFTAFLLTIHWLIFVLSFTILSFIVRRSYKLSLLILVGLLLIVNLALWKETLQTLVLVGMSTIISVSIGVPLGIWAAHRPVVYKVLRPLLDLMQTLPTFVYLIPTLILFGLGICPGLISTIIFAIAAPIRLTYLGISKTPHELKEAIIAFGASPWQRLVKVEIPSAWPSIMTGLSQCIMLSLSMVVIAALVGAEGLGEPVVRALNTVDIKLGCEAGLAIVIVAIILDRLLSGSIASSVGK